MIDLNKEVHLRIEWQNKLAIEQILSIFEVRHATKWFYKGHKKLKERTRPILIKVFTKLTKEELTYVLPSLEYMLHPVYGELIYEK